MMNTIHKIQEEQSVLLQHILDEVKTKINAISDDLVNRLTTQDGQVLLNELNSQITELESKQQRLITLMHDFEVQITAKQAELNLIERQLIMPECRQSLDDVPDLQRKYAELYKHEMGRLDEEEQQARKRLLVSMY